MSDAANAAMKVYVAPGDLDEYYLFASGGHSGQVYVYGAALVPGTSRRSPSSRPTRPPATASTTSRRRCWATSPGATCTIPPSPRRTGDYDGRWLFVNEMNGRVARIDLRDFKTKQIFGPIPNVSGNHASAFVTPNTEYAVMALALLDPDPQGHRHRCRQVRDRLQGRRDRRQDRPQDRRDVVRLADPAAALQLRPWRRGQAGLRRLGVLHLATTPSGRPASWRSPSAQRDRDYIAAVDWRLAEQLAAKGEGAMIGGVKVIDPAKNPGLVYLHALRQVAPRRRRLARRQVHHRLRASSRA